MKYPHVKIVAKLPCGNGACANGTIKRNLSGFGQGMREETCPQCHGTGETERELLHAGEPFFLVRGHDKLATATLAVYEALGRDAGADVTGLDELADRFREYQEANPGLVKLAD